MANESKTMGLPIAGKSGTITTSGSSQTTSALPDGTNCVYVICSADCFIAVGASLTVAANTGMFIPAGIPQYISASAGQTVSVIQSTAAGAFYYTPMA